MFKQSSIKAASDADKKLWANELRSSDSTLPNIKKAADEYTRLQLRETGVARVVLPVKPVSQADLDHQAGVKDPYIVYEMEPQSPAAVSLGFNGAADSYRFESSQYTLSFFDISTREYVANVKNLLIYKNDPRDIFVSNGLKDMQTEEDIQFFGGIDMAVGATPGVASALSGLVQNIQIVSPSTAPRAWNRDALTEAFKTLPRFRVPQGSVVCNVESFTNFGAFDRTEAGGDISQDMFKEGTAALKEAKAMGQRFVCSIKNDIFANDTMYLLTEPNYLGEFNELVAPTLFIEKKMDIVRFQARETIGVSLANVRGYAKVSLYQA
jgi:hypothetical protein